MILFPFSFTTSSGPPVVPLPTNAVAPSVVIIDSNTRELLYTAGTWADADSVSFAWFMNNAEQVGEVGTTFFADFGLDVKVVETAVNVTGTTIVNSNIVNVPPPPNYETGLVTWAFGGTSMDSMFAEPAVETGSVTWAFEGKNLDSYETPVDAGQVYWDVFGSVV